MKRIQLSKLFTDFFHSEKTGGIVLIVCTVLSILIANSTFGETYLHFWHQSIGFNVGSIDMHHPVEYWVNDGLMAIFFLMIGLEIERELYAGELSNVRNALLPVIAAMGGMLTPALFHFLWNHGTTEQAGIGIPMATDIAFALGILSLLGNRVPASLKIFLAALAIIDDLGAIIVIAVFYTEGFSLAYFGSAMGIFTLLIIFNRLRINYLIVYLIPGVFMWYFMLKSGVHATISGILLAFAIPFGDGSEKSISYKLQHFLHKPVAFFILPVFALANTGIVFEPGWQKGFGTKNTLGIMSGLILGKPIGIFLFCYAAVKTKICRLPSELSWKHITGAGMLAGIGFTMSIFITLLAFNDATTIVNAKIAVLSASVIAGAAGFLYLKAITPGLPDSSRPRG
ncbi:NhaA family Na+:H+ antiporter [Pseudobacter ginsenosidimutans]|uniref:Na(+)/H(+) antiporter NhaA n=2 Tax=Pseudobacter ginsenosidimutans TaxID=661488 RepID=A0A4Q7N3N4_9BACT|nr:NhaA family Na+:H+ antiporter [Pseudobacter ginsenosidimutans]